MSRTISTSTPVQPVLLSGGAGTRLWPMSRSAYPKQFIPLTTDWTLFQEAALRVAHPGLFRAPLVVCNEEHRFTVTDQLRQIGQSAAEIIVEPIARNTAPAIAVAALRALEADPEASLLVLPSDHIVGNVATFQSAVARAVEATRQGYFVAFGMTITQPETGYGYIRQGHPFDSIEGCWIAERFVEKPDRATAAGFMESGGYSWNSGIFALSAAQYVAELQQLQPKVLDACREALSRGKTDLDFFRLDAESFAAAPAISIDHAVMEHSQRIAVIPLEMGWSDVGSWAALWEVSEKDSSGNTVIGDVVTRDVTNCYLRSNDRLLATVGLEDIVVVATEDAVLVSTLDRTQDVKEIVGTLMSRDRSEATLAPVVSRPWGNYRTVDSGPRFQVKRITVKPKGVLSLQMHHHRAEHWVVVQGTARVTRGNEVMLLHENESIFIPLGQVHRLENPGKLDLHLIEVQSGPYLGEDDIVRLDDTYGRN